MAYRYKTAPFPHQRKVFAETANLAAYALLFEQGVGKSKPLIDTASYLFLEGKINALLVVAPNGVHRNWVSDEIPKHMPDDVVAKMRAMIWKSQSAGSKRSKSEQKQMLEWEGLSVLVVAYQATRTEKFKNFMKRFYARKTVMMVLDESHFIKTPGSPKRGKTTVTLTAMGKHAAYRRIATGTPLETPPDVYSQIRFVDPTFWERHGFDCFEAYKSHFCIEIEKSYGARSFSQIVGYKNLDELGDLIRKIGWRLTKEEAGLNLPPKLYSNRYCELTAEQNRVYQELKTAYTTKLYTGEELKAPSTITRMLRLQQVACGFVACEAEQPAQRVDLNSNPRMDLACDEILDSLPHQAIVFHRFREDLLDMVKRLGPRCVPYHGKVSDDDRAKNKLAFQNGDVQFFIGSYAAATGLTLVGAKTVIYYSNSFELIKRLQSEDRAHRIGTTTSVNYIDLIAEGTIDEYIVNALRKKFDIVTQVTQDEIRPWLQLK
jgi:SNF2 family DNA or RNA helicase